MVKKEKEMSNEALTSTDPAPLQSSTAATPDIKCGIATDLWLELDPYDPQDPNRKPRLNLRVNERWRYLESPSAATQQSVQSVFCSCCDQRECEVVVWYKNDVIKGLVVRSQFPSTQR
jgi:hypothetical protein